MVVKPKLLKGFRDYLPGEMIARQKIIATIKEVYESYGFVPLGTPALEYKEILLGYGDEASKQIYTFTDKDENEVGLIFDLTVSLSRVIAQYQDIPRPFKRYQIQPVWRYDKPDPGRFREFIQFDIDIVGTYSMIADAEIIAAMSGCLKKLGLSFQIKYSNRKILNSLINFAGIDDSMKHTVFRVIDKLEKQGLDAVKLELGPGRTDKSGDVIPGLELKQEQIEKIVEFLRIPQPTRDEAINSLKVLFNDVRNAEEGINELSEINDYLEAMNIPEENATIDASIARGLDYYTGPIYEAFLTDKKVTRLGSVMGGGRFDTLIGQFIKQDIPATGASIGVDRLLEAVLKLGLIETRSSTADILITVMIPERTIFYLQIADELRNAGINTELYIGKGNIGKQLKYADRQGIPIAVIIGPDEFEKNEVAIKDLRKLETTDVEIKDRDEWLKFRMGQQAVARGKLLETAKMLLAH